MVHKRLSVFFNLFVIVSAFGLFVPEAHTASLRDKLTGRILLQVESHGEAWYVDPENKLRHYLGRPEDAFALMQRFGQGIADSALMKIPLDPQIVPADFATIAREDQDGDGLRDALEDAFGTDKTLDDSDGDGYRDGEEAAHGYDPLSTGKLPVDWQDAEYLKGRILLQVQRHGEAWYVNPVDKRRYFLGRPADAFALMRRLGLGITNSDLETIPQEGDSQLSLDSQRYEDIRQIRVALELFYGMNGDRFPVVTTPVVLGEGNYSCFGQHGFAARGSAECTGPYMPIIPHNPTPGGAPYVYHAPTSADYSLSFRLETGYKQGGYEDLSAGDYVASRLQIVPKTE